MWLNSKGFLARKRIEKTDFIRSYYQAVSLMLYIDTALIEK